MAERSEASHRRAQRGASWLSEAKPLIAERSEAPYYSTPKRIRTEKLMEILDRTFLGNAVLDWLMAAGVAVLILLVLKAVKVFVIRKVSAFSARTANDIDDLVVAILERTRVFFLLALALVGASQFLELSSRIRDIIEALVFLATLLQLGFWGNAGIEIGLGRYTSRRLAEDAAEEATTIRFVGFLLRLGLWVLVFLVALDTAGVDITALIAGLGVGGIAVALAVQNILGDLFASLSIVLDKPFVIGDFIIVGDMMGTVEHIGMKTTRVRSLSGEQLVFGNTDLLNSRIRNYKRMQERRALFRFGITYQTARDQVARIPDIVREIIDSREETRFDRAHFAGFGDSSLDFEVVYYMLVPEYNVYMDTQQAVNLELMGRFEELGVEFAYPTRTVYVEQPSDS